MRENCIKAIYGAPGKTPIFIEVENTLEALQQAVGGYIESVTVEDDVCILCDEEGRLKGLQPTMTYKGIDFVGPVLFVGVKGEDFCSIPDDYVKMIQSMGIKIEQ